MALPPEAVRNVRLATSSDLENLRSLIEELYEYRTQEEVINFIAASDYALKITPNMFKKRVKKWKIDKKRKSDEMHAIVRIDQQRSQLGKRTWFHIRGRSVKYQDIATYWRRRNMTIQDVLSTHAIRESTPEDVSYGTPPLSPVLQPVMVGETEIILRKTLEHVASFANCTCTENDTILAGFAQGWEAAASLFAIAEFQRGGIYLRSAAAQIRDVLLEQDIGLLAKIFFAIFNMDRRGFPEVGEALLKQTSALSQVTLGRNSPISQIFAVLETSIPCVALRKDIITRASTLMADCLDFTDRSSYLNGVKQLEVCSIAAQIDDDVIRKLETGLAVIAVDPAHLGELRLFFGVMLCNIFSSRGMFCRLKKQDLHLWNVISLRFKNGTMHRTHPWRIQALIFHAEAEAGLGRFGSAIVLARHAISLHVQTGLSITYQIVMLMACLQDWLECSGQGSAAQEVEAYLQAMHEKLLPEDV